MNLAVISGAGWMQYQCAAYALLQRMANTKSTDTILIDFETITRENAIQISSSYFVQNINASMLPGYVLFEQWIKDSRMALDAIDAHAILATAQRIPLENIVIIDARNYDLDLIIKALEKVRLAWYPLDQWHPTFAVISDDVHLLGLLSVITNVFYCQPQVLSEREIRLIVKGVMRRAFIYRWFGSGAGRIARSMSKIVGRVKGLQNKLNDYVNNEAQS